MKIKNLHRVFAILMVASIISCGEIESENEQNLQKGQIVSSKRISLSNYPSFSLTEGDPSEVTGNYLTISGSIKLPNIPGAERNVGCLDITIEDIENNGKTGILQLFGSPLQGVTYEGQEIDIQADIDGWKTLSKDHSLILAEFPANEVKNFQKTVCFRLDYSEVPFQVYQGSITIEYMIGPSPADIIDCTLHPENSFCKDIFPAADSSTEDESDANPDTDSPPSNESPDSPEEDNLPNTPFPEDEEVDDDNSDATNQEGDTSAPDAGDNNDSNSSNSDSDNSEKNNLNWPVHCPEVKNSENPLYHHVTSGQNEIAIENSTAIKITGNKSSILISDTVDRRISILCLVLTGNQTNAQILVSGEFEKIVIVARGNHSKTYIHVMETGSVNEFSLDFKGNNPSVKINGDGNYSCPSQTDVGSNSCQH